LEAQISEEKMGQKKNAMNTKKTLRKSARKQAHGSSSSILKV
jgi:hypothetical protein